ncbi:MAG: YcgN family cysteine cluster protein [Gammaproteobacteria bacterium]|nr:YcgN family cysteine cluster protein [Gammaproteobacteria bacterium]
MTEQLPFWQRKTLEELSREEWESLCDGCGKCCLNKLEDLDSGALHYTNVACNLLDLNSCRCSDYPNRSVRVPECVTLTPQNSRELNWMPATCAYRLLAAGKDLPAWHPLRSGDQTAMQRAGQCICGRVIHEKHADKLEYHLITWVS